MSRSPKLSPTLQKESDTPQCQLSLFAGRTDDDGDGGKDRTKKEEKVNKADKTEAITKTETKSSTKSKKNVAYSAADIQVLEGLAAIRHRPGMYIGSTSTSGLLHLIWEALDNAVDEAVAGYGKHIWTHIDRTGWITVRDEARGMPFDPMFYRGDYLPAATVILT